MVAQLLEVVTVAEAHLPEGEQEALQVEAHTTSGSSNQGIVLKRASAMRRVKRAIVGMRARLRRTVQPRQNLPATVQDAVHLL